MRGSTACWSWHGPVVVELLDRQRLMGCLDWWLCWLWAEDTRDCRWSPTGLQGCSSTRGSYRVGVCCCRFLCASRQALDISASNVCWTSIHVSMSSRRAILPRACMNDSTSSWKSLLAVSTLSSFSWTRDRDPTRSSTCEAWEIDLMLVGSNRNSACNYTYTRNRLHWR